METKKISFGFSKTTKDSIKVKPVVEVKSEPQFVDTFDGKKGTFSFKGTTRLNGPVKKELVIPLIGTKNAYEVIKEKLDKKEQNQTEEPIDVKPTLDQLAASEILNNLNSNTTTVSLKPGLVIKTEDLKPNFDGEKESTLDDYEDVPVNEFGLAMLRGMGWNPKSGIGKEQRIVEPVIANVRPKRLGLGAETLIKKQLDVENELPLKPGAFVKIHSGPYRGHFGVVQSLDCDCAQVFIKLNTGTLSISEHLVEVISKNEYTKQNRQVEPIKESNEGRQRSRDHDHDRKKKKKRSRSRSRSSDESKRRRHKQKHKREKSKKKSKYSDESSDDNFRRKHR